MTAVFLRFLIFLVVHFKAIFLTCSDTQAAVSDILFEREKNKINGYFFNSQPPTNAAPSTVIAIGRGR